MHFYFLFLFRYDSDPPEDEEDVAVEHQGHDMMAMMDALDVEGGGETGPGVQLGEAGMEMKEQGDHCRLTRF